MSFLSFLISFLVLIMLGACFIIGFYIITRGERIQQPDGSVVTTGKILRGWSLFWERQTGTTKVYFRGKTLRDKFNFLVDCNAELGKKLGLQEGDASLTIGAMTIASEDIRYIQDLLHCQVEVDSAGCLFLYLYEPTYYFPEFLRYPLSQCPPCMASVFGSLVYWGILLQYPEAFAWSNAPYFGIFYFWVFFCISLAAGNKLLYNLAGV